MFLCVFSYTTTQYTDSSFSYFCNPNFKSMIEAIPGTYTSKDELKYKAISSGDYLVQRLAATY